MRADLHMHSTYSDGTLSLKELVQYAEEKEIDVIAITDHDSIESAKDIKRDWHLIDANGKILGRLAVEVATKLSGKAKTNFVPYLDTGDYVVVTNASKVKMTGKKPQQKIYGFFNRKCIIQSPDWLYHGLYRAKRRRQNHYDQVNS
jgi:hypothetical protein